MAQTSLDDGSARRREQQRRREDASFHLLFYCVSSRFLLKHKALFYVLGFNTLKQRKFKTQQKNERVRTHARVLNAQREREIRVKVSAVERRQKTTRFFFVRLFSHERARVDDKQRASLFAFRSASSRLVFEKMGAENLPKIPREKEKKRDHILSLSSLSLSAASCRFWSLAGFFVRSSRLHCVYSTRREEETHTTLSLLF